MPRHPPYALNSFITPTSNRQLSLATFSLSHASDRLIQRPVEAPHSHTRGDVLGLVRHGQAPQTLLLGVTFKNSATPKNLSNCQRAMSHAEAVDVLSAAAGRASCCHFSGVTCCSAQSRVGECSGSFQAVKPREPSGGGTAFVVPKSSGLRSLLAAVSSSFVPRCEVQREGQVYQDKTPCQPAPPPAVDKSRSGPTKAAEPRLSVR